MDHRATHRKHPRFPLLFDHSSQLVQAGATGPGGRISADDAVDIWIARWLRVRRKDLIARYGCDPRRLYEIWWGEKFPASREKAVALFKQRYPGLADHTDFGYRRIPRPKVSDDVQPRLFD